MSPITTTLWSAYLQTTSHLQLPFSIIEHTTVNERLEINQNQGLDAGKIPGMRYLVIGNQGHRAVAGQNNFALTVPVDHSADHASCYGPIPFVLRAVNEDLTPDEKAKYALRKPVTIGERNYYAYYAKRLDLSNTKVELKKTIKENGNSNTSPYVPTQANLYPVWPDVPVTGAVSTSGEYLSASAILNVNFTAKDVAELINVAKILYNDEAYAVVSEFGFCTGVDKTLSIQTPAGTTNMNEVVACQIATFVTGHYEMVYNNQGFDFQVELGAVQPLLGAEQITTATVIG
jgi:hypothetical protein